MTNDDEPTAAGVVRDGDHACETRLRAVSASAATPSLLSPSPQLPHPLPRPMLSHIAAHHSLSDNDMQLDSDSASNSPMSALSPVRQQIKYDSDADDDDDARAEVDAEMDADADADADPDFVDDADASQNNLSYAAGPSRYVGNVSHAAQALLLYRVSLLCL